MPPKAGDFPHFPTTLFIFQPVGGALLVKPLLQDDVLHSRWPPKILQPLCIIHFTTAATVTPAIALGTHEAPETTGGRQPTWWLLGPQAAGVCAANGVLHESGIEVDGLEGLGLRECSTSMIPTGVTWSWVAFLVPSSEWSSWALRLPPSSAPLCDSW